MITEIGDVDSMAKSRANNAGMELRSAALHREMWRCCTSSHGAMLHGAVCSCTVGCGGDAVGEEFTSG